MVLHIIWTKQLLPCDDPFALGCPQITDPTRVLTVTIINGIQLYTIYVASTGLVQVCLNLALLAPLLLAFTKMKHTFVRTPVEHLFCNGCLCVHDKYLCITQLSRSVVPLFSLLSAAVSFYCILRMICREIYNLRSYRSDRFLPKFKILVNHGRLGGASYRLMQTKAIILDFPPFTQQPSMSLTM